MVLISLPLKTGPLISTESTVIAALATPANTVKTIRAAIKVAVSLFIILLR
jgi:hypothetical protein